MKNKKILFLDHDGVICLPDNFGSRWGKNGNGVFDNFDVKSIKILNEIIEVTDCEIVVTSDWRLHCDLDFMRDFYIKQGIKKVPISYTTELTYHPTLEGEDKLIEKRVKEISEFIKQNEISKWVVVDDLNLNKDEILKDIDLPEKWSRNFVITKKKFEGIKQSNKKNIIIKKLMS